MHHVESLQVLLILIGQHVVDLPQPREGGVVAVGGERVEIGDYVIASYYRV